MLDFDKAGGLIPAVAQDADTGEVLMLAWMNREAFEETVRTGRAVYFSRSRNKLWRKGEESGHFQEVRGIFIDCDADTVLLKVKQIGGAACHEGYKSCFFRQLEGDELKVIAERIFDPTYLHRASASTALLVATMGSFSRTSSIGFAQLPSFACRRGNS